MKFAAKREFPGRGLCTFTTAKQQQAEPDCFIHSSSDHQMDMDTEEIIRSDSIVSCSLSGLNYVTPEWNAFESDILQLLSEEKPGTTGNTVQVHPQLIQSHHNFVSCVYREFREENSDKKWGK